MSPAKSLSQLRTAKPYAAAIHTRPLDADPNGGEDRPASRRAACISRAWPAIAQLAFEAQEAFPHLLLALVSFVISEFLQGCAAYAQAMHPIHVPVMPYDDDVRERTMSSQNRELAKPAAKTTRLVLVVTRSGRAATFEKSPEKFSAPPT